jgi:hypothetical protein
MRCFTLYHFTTPITPLFTYILFCLTFPVHYYLLFTCSLPSLFHSTTISSLRHHYSGIDLIGMPEMPETAPTTSPTLFQRTRRPPRPILYPEDAMDLLLCYPRPLGDRKFSCFGTDVFLVHVSLTTPFWLLLCFINHYSPPYPEASPSLLGCWQQLSEHTWVATLGFGLSILSSLIEVGERLCLPVLCVSCSALSIPSDVRPG